MRIERAVLALSMSSCALVVACKRPSPAESTGQSASSSGLAAPPPPPLDTSWQRDPGHLLAQGETAPDFEGIAHNGMRVKLSAFLEKPVVVYFAGRDETPEGSAEARRYREAWMRFNEKVGAVLGVSANDRASHYDFATAERLPFLLVADESGQIARAFGVRTEPPGVATFVVGPDRKIVRVISEALPGGHAEEIVKVFEAPR